MRKALIAGNWKMYTTPSAAETLAKGLKSSLGNCSWADIVVCPPYTSLHPVIAALKGTGIGIGGQNMHWETEGAFTGEISPNMLKEFGCEWVIIGHSERRAYFGETDEKIMKKTRAAIEAGLKPIVCVGETLDQRDAGITQKIVESQIIDGLKRMGEIEQVTIAYEPVWAIGTGRTATPEQAQEVHQFIRGLISRTWSEAIGSAMRILYGGSVKPDNAANLWAKEDIDGFLVGGASLKADSFTAIAEAAK